MRAGGDEEIAIDLRVIAATNRDHDKLAGRRVVGAEDERDTQPMAVAK